MHTSSKLYNIHPTFHVSYLKKCLTKGNLHIPLDEVHNDESMHTFERPVKIMDCKDKETKRSRVPLAKFRWGLNMVSSLLGSTKIQ